MLPIRFHLPIMVACEFLGFFAGVVPVMVAWVRGGFGDSLLLGAGSAILAGILGVMAPRILFRKVWPARCDQADCRGRSFPEGSDPIIYVCGLCGHKTVTNVSDGGDSRQWHNR